MNRRSLFQTALAGIGVFFAPKVAPASPVVAVVSDVRMLWKKGFETFEVVPNFFDDDESDFCFSDGGAHKISFSLTSD